MKHPQGLLVKVANCLTYSRKLECKVQLLIWTLAIMTCDVQLGFSVGELGVTAAAVAASHEAEDGVPVAACEFVSQLKGKLVASLSRASVRFSGVGLRAAQGGCQLSEGRV